MQLLRGTIPMELLLNLTLTTITTNKTFQKNSSVVQMRYERNHPFFLSMHLTNISKLPLTYLLTSSFKN